MISRTFETAAKLTAAQLSITCSLLELGCIQAARALRHGLWLTDLAVMVTLPVIPATTVIGSVFGCLSGRVEVPGRGGLRDKIATQVVDTLSGVGE